MAQVRSVTIHQKLEEVYAALQHAVSFHCLSQAMCGGLCDFTRSTSLFPSSPVFLTSLPTVSIDITLAGDDLVPKATVTWQCSMDYKFANSFDIQCGCKVGSLSTDTSIIHNITWDSDRAANGNERGVRSVCNRTARLGGGSRDLIVIGLCSSKQFSASQLVVCCLNHAEVLLCH